ncbi:MAG: phage terminase large subunit [Dyella sp.]|uniref:phage terminase large subunit n=1 Tax=Dyella sp. TaxID=1869338 RepID=UPI003F81547C
MKLTPKQEEGRQLLAGPQRHTLAVGGSRSGKTFLLTRQLCVRAIKAPGSRHGIFRLRYNALRASIWLDTLPKVMRICFPGVRYENKRQDGYVELPNESQIWFVGLDDKDRVEKILGLEFATLYFNECSQLPYSSVLTARTRLAQQVQGLQNRAYYDLNPGGSGHWTHREFVEHVDPVTRRPLSNPDDYRMLYINPADNLDNIDPDYVKTLEAMPEKHRRRFLDGRYVAEIDGALWTIELLEQQRIAKDDLPQMRRVVVAVDPSGCSGKEDWRSDEVGITVCALGQDDNGYLLADLSGRYSPEQWGRIAVKAWRDYGADRIIGERNFGGDMVRAVVHSADRNAPFKEVTASRGKVARAEPVSALYEQGRIFHAGTFATLEEQLCNFSTAGFLGDRSPDRADSSVWGFTELMVGECTTGLLDHYRSQLQQQDADAHA